MLLLLVIVYNVFAGTRERWSYLILLQALPALLSLVVFPCLPESPRYLLLVRRDRQGAVNGTRVGIIQL